MNQGPEICHGLAVHKGMTHAVCIWNELALAYEAPM